ncbi:hypothetical protein [Haloarcula onubensis]|uniref:SMODS-associating 2TM beta-strand rich effector domain-containing protein n=1 Tax=Haloarcula onubensis TaxID=2950539 RepID=A0ABU2FIK0_9EURY|nr:hypothetical protein [Halomicroarcula sp. S3CR25-11]MDS0280557.1 hypothetical protein [Halomicroarcula sp. S3CR25-11]
MNWQRLRSEKLSVEKGVGIAVVFSHVALLVVGLTLFSMGLLTTAIDSIFPNATPSEAGNISLSVISILVNTLLTGGLIWIYLRQTRVLEDQRDISEEQASIAEEQTSISEEQTSIQERQQEIMEAEYIPAVDISVTEASDDSITIHCSNQGTGLAKQFKIDVEFYVGEEAIDGPADYDMGVEVEPLSDKVFTSTEQDTPRGEVTFRATYAGGATTPKRVGADEDLPQTRTEEILREDDEQDLNFSLYFERYVDPGGEQPSRFSFSDGVAELIEEGVSTLGFGISISYCDIFDNKVADRILATGWIDIRDGAGVEQLFEDSENRTILSHKQPSFDDEGNLSLRNGEKVHRTGHYSYL